MLFFFPLSLLTYLRNRKSRNMALGTFVKINAITNLTDARYCAGMFVDMLGFSFEAGSDRFTNHTTFKEIVGWVSGVDFVAEYDSAGVDEIQATLDQCPEITWIEHKDLSILLQFQQKGLNPIYKLTFPEAAQLDNSTINQLKSADIKIHLVDLKSTLSEADNKVMANLTQELNVILGTGINASNVQRQVEELHLFGISMTGGDEIKPGLMDFNELADILEVLELED